MPPEATAPVDRPRILIVEDEGLVAWDVEQGLRASFDVVGVADNSADALRMAHERTPDLVLMDIRIRGEADGVTTAATLRRELGVPVVYLTAHSDAETLRRAGETDPYGYLLKPFRRPDLLNAVGIALSRRQLEQRIRARERFLATTLQSIVDAVVLVDENGRVTHLNPAAEKLLGRSAEDAKLQPVEQLFVLHDDVTGELVRSPVGRALSEQVAVHAPAARLESPGGARFVTQTACPISDGADNFGAVLILRDVTEARRLEQQLVTSDRLAALGTMAAGIAHEINNPMAFVVANLEHIGLELEAHRTAIASRLDAEETARLTDIEAAIADAREGTERVTKIVRQLASFGRDTPGDGGHANLVEVAAWALAVTSHRWRHCAIVHRDFQPVPRIAGSPTSLSQVLVNLIANAAQAIEQAGGKRGAIDVRLRTGSDGWAEVEVEDDGPGIPTNVVKHVFEPFFTTKPIGVGTGLGLSISQSIIAKLGGTIEVDTAPGRGTRFRIRLPPADPSVPPPATPTVVLPRPKERRVQRRVLVIDDDELVRMAIVRVLAPHHLVESVSTAREARPILREGVDVVLCDLMMPDESGMDLFAQLESSDPAILHRFAFITGGAVSEAASRFLQESRVARLHKPFRSAELLDLVDQLGAAPRGTA